MTQKSICQVDSFGAKRWYLNGQLHREDGPAIWRDGRQVWIQHGEYHREDGPAIVLHNGLSEWWLNNNYYTFEEYVKKAKWSDEQIVMYKLAHG